MLMFDWLTFRLVSWVRLVRTRSQVSKEVGQQVYGTLMIV